MGADLQPSGREVVAALHRSRKARVRELEKAMLFDRFTTSLLSDAELLANAKQFFANPPPATTSPWSHEALKWMESLLANATSNNDLLDQWIEAADDET